ncbi:MAG: 2-hydroxyacid dehydrogenase [Actinomycetota bacterium]
MPVLVALIPPPSPPEAAAMAYGGLLGPEWTVQGFRSEDDVPDEVAADAEFVVAAASQRVSTLFDRAPRLRVVQIPGHGFDHVDLEAAERAGVPVCTVASSGAESHTVAEMALLLAGVASRRVVAGDRLVRDGKWGTQEMLFGGGGVFELAGKTLGIVGYGRIGRELAKRARAFDMRVVCSDVVPVEDDDVEVIELDALLAQSDVVSLHAPLTPATRHLINGEALAKMKAGSILVNTARGPLVDADALARALASGRLRAAAIDVFDPEPPSADSPLLQLDNVVLSPHMAGVAQESVMRILGAALQNCRRVADGQPPHDVVTGD